MRISDWSSDVCSSDLRCAAAAASPASVAGRGARTQLARRASRAAGQRDVARTEDADAGLAGGLRLDIARPGDRYIDVARDEPFGIDAARSGDADVARRDIAAADFDIARSRNLDLGILARQLRDLEVARSRHRRFDRVAIDAVGVDRPR